MTEQQIKNIMAFLQRVQLQGSEVPAYVDAMETLQNELAKLSNIVEKS